MEADRIPGRPPAAGEMGFPAECGARQAWYLNPCEVEIHGGECLLCRHPEVGFPPHWQGFRGWIIEEGRSVQAINTQRADEAWVVAVMARGKCLDPQFPPIVCKSRDRAIALAHARAAQLRPEAKVDRRDDGSGIWNYPDGLLVVVVDRIP